MSITDQQARRGGVLYDTAPRFFTGAHVVTLSFTVFLILIIVGNDPFAARTPEALKAMTEGAGEGNALRQLQFLLLFIMVMAVCLPTLKLETFSGIAMPHILSILWSAVSVLWAIDAEITARRAALLVIVVFTTSGSVRYLGIEKSLKILYWVLVGTVIICWISLPLTPNAVHPQTEADRALIGAWRGLFFQKNLAGAVLGVSTLLFLHVAVTHGRKWDWSILILSAGFLAGTMSKTSIALFAVAAALSLAYRLAWRSDLGRYIFISCLWFALVAAILLVLAEWNTVYRIFTDPTSFTGRVAIWETALAYVADHPLLGAGYSSFWQIGYASPANWLATEDFVKDIPHSHNGYIEILVTTGIVGLLFAVLGFFVWPLQQFLEKDRSGAPLKAMLFGVWAFVIMHNFSETSFFARDKQLWIIFLVSIVILQLNRKLAVKY